MKGLASLRPLAREQAAAAAREALVLREKGEQERYARRREQSRLYNLRRQRLDLSLLGALHGAAGVTLDGWPDLVAPHEAQTTRQLQDADPTAAVLRQLTRRCALEHHMRVLLTMYAGHAAGGVWLRPEGLALLRKHHPEHYGAVQP